MAVLDYTKQSAVASHVMSNATGSTVWHLLVPPLNNRVRKVKGVKGMFAMSFPPPANNTTPNECSGYTCWLRLPQQAGIPATTEYDIDNRRLWVPTPFVVAGNTTMYKETPWLKAADITDQDALYFGVYVSQRSTNIFPYFTASFEWAEARELKA